MEPTIFGASCIKVILKAIRRLERVLMRLRLSLLGLKVMAAIQSNPSAVGTATQPQTPTMSAETGNQQSSASRPNSNPSELFPVFFFIHTQLASPFDLLVHHPPPPVMDDLYS